jgi:hypothetical protein
MMDNLGQSPFALGLAALTKRLGSQGVGLKIMPSFGVHDSYILNGMRHNLSVCVVTDHQEGRSLL